MKPLVWIVTGLSWLLLALGGITAAAACDVSLYDRTPPNAIRDNVTVAAHFEWATDADTATAGMWIWHYVLNKDSSGLRFQWDKARLEHSTAYPLPPGTPACRRKFAYEVADRADTDAPILYTTRNLSQDAAVFVEAKSTAISNRSATELSTHYLGADGERQQATLSVRSSTDGEVLYLEFEAPKHLTVGIGGITDSLSGGQLKLLVEQLERSGAEVQIDTLDNYADHPSVSELAADLEQEYIFISEIDGTIKVEVAANSPIEREFAVMLFDGNRIPILRSAVAMLAPA